MFEFWKQAYRSTDICYQLILAASLITVTQVATDAFASLPDPLSGINDSEYLRFHGRGDVLRTATPFDSCIAFPSSLPNDPSALHARMRIRLAPESEYTVLDQTNGGTHAPGRVLWTQSIVDQANYAGFTIAYRHDTDELYFVVGDGGGSTVRTRVWRIPVVLDDGAFRTIDLSYNDLAGKAGCWIDGVQYSPISVTKNGGAIDPAPEFLGSWSAGGSIMGNARSDAMYTLAGRGWNNDIGARDVVWPAPNGTGSTDGNILDENTSVLGDLAYAAFRWANAVEDISTSPWSMELELNSGPALVDSANGLDSQGLISAEHDSVLPFWADTNTGQDITGWMIGDLPDPEDTQTRQLMFYHHGLGNQSITVTEDDGGGLPLDQSLVCCIGPSGDIEYWAIKSKIGAAAPTQYTLLGQTPTAGVHTFDLPAGEPGLYRIIVRSTRNEGYSFATDQESLYWGAYSPFSLLTGVDGLSQNDSYAYIPQDSDVYDLYLGDITDPTEEDFTGGSNILATNGGIVNGSIVYGGSALGFNVSPGIIKMHLGSNWQIGSRRFPLVLSNSRYAAEFYIRAGVTEAASFTHWSPDDKALRDRIVEIASAGLGDANIIAKDFDDPHGVHIMGNQRRYFSLATYPYGIKIIHTALQNQITSTSSAMIGSIDHDPLDSNVILRYGDEPNSIYNFDQFGPALLFWAGWDDTNANPYYGDIDFRNRARCAGLAFARHVQGTRIRATETDVGLHPGNAGLAGTDDFGMVLHWGRVYNLFDAADRAAILPAAVIELCHILNVNPTSTRNQDAHFLPFLYEVGKLWEQQNPGQASQMLSTITEEYARLIVDRPSPWDGADVAMQEARGFDGSYSGMQNHMIAMGWLASGPEFDPSLFNPSFTSSMNREWDFLRDTLDRQYGFWAHYMGPPLDGTQTVFAHDSDSRTNMGAVREQYNGAKETGSMASPMAARLLLEDGSDLAADLIDGDTVIPTNLFPLDLNPLPTTSWTNISNGRGGWRFDLMALYAGGVEHLFDSTTGDPIDTGAVLPCEEPVSAGFSLTIEEIDEAFIAINTPSYYAIVSTRDPGEFYYKRAFAKYQEPREVEKASNLNGGGDITNINFPNGDTYSSGEEIGGVGLSFFYDKTGGGPVISGRNWTPLTTHQLIGNTSIGNRRWADQHSREFAVNKTYSIDSLIQVDLTIDYDLNIDPNGSSTASYHVQRVLHFYPESIGVDVTISLPTVGVAEPLTALYENIPFELSVSVIGQSEWSQRLFGLENLTHPWVGGSIWDTWIGNSWTTSNNDGLSYRGQEIGWLQNEIPIPTSSASMLSYTIGVVNPPSQILYTEDEGKLESVSYTDAIAFLRAVEQGDPEADINGDGKITQKDFDLVFRGKIKFGDVLEWFQAV